MSSKYDFYWKKRINEVAELIQEARKFGVSNRLDVNDLKNYGSRKAWYGVVEVHNKGVEKGEMAHAKSLGHIVYRELTDFLDDKGLKLTITSDLDLVVQMQGVNTKARKCRDGSMGSDYKKDQIRADFNQTTSISKEKIQVNRDKVVNIFKEIPWDVWKRIVKAEPEWGNMVGFLKYYDFGSFSTLMVVAGLNDFQLKGKAEKAYWPPLKEELKNSPVPSTPQELAGILEPFYQKERYAQLKVKRLHKFLNSNLANLLWHSKPENVTNILPYIWRELTKTMNQDYNAKTIVFAMKCLGISLLMVEETGFDFTRVPIPVDVRVLQLTKKLGLCKSCDESELQSIWSDVLKRLQNYCSEITMIHLDSLVWQIASLDREQIKSYFEELGVHEAADELLEFLETFNMNEEDHKNIGENRKLDYFKSFASSSGIIKEDHNQKESIVCFIPCCKSKDASGRRVETEQSIKPHDIPDTWGLLRKGRRGMEYCVDFDSPLTTAIYLYTGHFYQPLDPIKEEIVNKAQTGEINILIISAGYGVLNALESIHNYDEVMKGKVASRWKSSQLEQVLAEYLVRKQPDKVYGFFAGSEDWNFNASSYRFFYTAGVKLAIKNGLKAKAGCFYRKEGWGSSPILGALGNTLKAFLESDFDDKFIEDIMQHDREEGGVTIGYRPFL